MHDHPSVTTCPGPAPAPASRRARPLLLAGALALLAGTGGCNRYDNFRLTGFIQESFSNKADIVFVIDNSPSMTGEATSLASNFAQFIEAFTEGEAELPENPDLADDVDRFLDYVLSPTGNVNYSIGVTTTEPSKVWGQLLGSPIALQPTDDAVVPKFTDNLLCNAVCYGGESGDASVSCSTGDPRTRNCADSERGAAEEGIESAYMAMCRAVENPPDACFQEWYFDRTDGRYYRDPVEGPSTDTDTLGTDTSDTDGSFVPPEPYFTDADIGTNADWLRDGSTVVPVIVSDEGDQSRRIDTRDGQVFPYDQFFREFERRFVWAVIGPAEAPCNTAGAARWGVTRYQQFVNATNGRYIPIAESDGRGGCSATDFGQALTQIGELLRALTDTFPLRAVPDQETIVVQVDGEVIAKAERTLDATLGAEVFSDGWSYRPTDNAVVLHGDAVPDFNADVRIYYLPLEGQPRELPF